ncbi:MAG TPA: hypothetical protein VF188_13770 [Longimicrobiales bacterium]
MRLSIAILFLGLSSCADTVDRPKPKVVTGLAEGAAPARCEAVAPAFEIPASLDQMAASPDSVLALLYADAGVIQIADHALRPVRSYSLAETGPEAVANPRDVTFGAGGRLAVLDGALHRLVHLTGNGDIADYTTLQFVPDRFARAANGYYIFPVKPPTHTTGLAYFLADSLDDPVRLPLEAADVPNPQIYSLANLMVPLVRGRELLAAHQFVVPIMHVVRMTVAGARVRRVDIPIAAELADRAWWTPEPPFEETELQDMLVPVVDMVAGRAGEPVLLVRTGRRRDGHYEKGLMRLTDTLEFRDAFLLEGDPAYIAYLAAKDVYVAASTEGEFWRCTLPS